MSSAAERVRAALRQWPARESELQCLLALLGPAGGAPDASRGAAGGAAAPPACNILAYGPAGGGKGGVVRAALQVRAWRARGRAGAAGAPPRTAPPPRAPCCAP